MVEKGCGKADNILAYGFPSSTTLSLKRDVHVIGDVMRTVTPISILYKAMNEVVRPL